MLNYFKYKKFTAGCSFALYNYRENQIYLSFAMGNGEDGQIGRAHV